MQTLPQWVNAILCVPSSLGQELVRRALDPYLCVPSALGQETETLLAARWKENPSTTNEQDVGCVWSD